jgi:hypothetical protein
MGSKYAEQQRMLISLAYSSQSKNWDGKGRTANNKKSKTPKKAKTKKEETEMTAGRKGEKGPITEH